MDFKATAPVSLPAQAFRIDEVELTQGNVYNRDAHQYSFTESCLPLYLLSLNGSGCNEWSYIQTGDHIELDATIDTKYLSCRLTPN